MFKQRRFERDLISEAIRSAVDTVVSEHFGALTQEAQLTSRIAADLEARLNGLRVFDLSMRVIAQEMPDRGRGALEKKSGADLYIGIELVTPEESLTKGLFVQAKWEGKHTRSEQAELVEQCGKLTARTTASQVWLYGPSGVSAVPAQEVVAHPGSPPEMLGSKKLNEVFQQVLDCFEGDPRYGLPDEQNVRAALSDMLQEFSVPTGLAISIGADGDA